MPDQNTDLDRIKKTIPSKRAKPASKKDSTYGDNAPMRESGYAAGFRPDEEDSTSELRTRSRLPAGTPPG